MQIDRSSERGFFFAGLLLFIFLVGALATYFIPIVKIEVPPLGEMKWAVSDVVDILPKVSFEKKEGKRMFDIDFKKNREFLDLLEKILPKSEAGGMNKANLTFILGILVPIALALTYFLIIACLLFSIVRLKKFVVFLAGTACLSSCYALFGFFQLGVQAEKVFDQAVAKAGEGALGLITKHLVPEITVAPDTGLYALLGACILVFFASLLRAK